MRKKFLFLLTIFSLCFAVICYAENYDDEEEDLEMEDEEIEVSTITVKKEIIPMEENLPESPTITKEDSQNNPEKKEIIPVKEIVPEVSTITKEVSQEKLEKEDNVVEIKDNLLLNFDIYISKSGDTLMSIASKYYENSSEWKNIWDYNKYIKDPGQIPTGTEIIVPLQKKPEPKVKLQTSIINRDSIILEAQNKKKEDEKNYMIVPETFKFDGYISGQKLERLMISSSDIVYVDVGAKNDVEVGDKYTIYRRGKEVIHPENETVMGTVVEKIGHLEIIGGIQENSSAAIILSSFEPITIGDMIKKIIKK